MKLVEEVIYRIAQSNLGFKLAKNNESYQAVILENAWLWKQIEKLTDRLAEPSGTRTKGAK